MCGYPWLLPEEGASKKKSTLLHSQKSLGHLISLHIPSSFKLASDVHMYQSQLLSLQERSR